MPTACAHAERVGETARLALLKEAELTPKPGLVDALSCGAHTDMDLGTFRASVGAIGPWFEVFFRIGRDYHHLEGPDFLAALRSVGRECEREMFLATGGVNTHKGSIFALGLLCGCTGRLWKGTLPVRDRLCAEVAWISAPLVAQELADNPEPRTAGERLYRAHGLQGARGEAASGFCTVRHHGLPAYEATWQATRNEDLALGQALLALLAHNQDTNLAADGGLEAIAHVRAQAQTLLAAGGALAPDYQARMEAFDRDLTARGLSPGGTADLLAVTWFLAQWDRGTLA